MPTAALGRGSGQILPSLSLSPLTSYQTPHQPNPTRGWAHPGMLPAKPNQRVGTRACCQPNPTRGWAPGHATSQTQPEGGHPGMLPAKPNQRVGTWACWRQSVCARWSLGAPGAVEMGSWRGWRAEGGQ